MRKFLFLLGVSLTLPASAAGQRRLPDYSGSWTLRDSAETAPAPRDTVRVDSALTDTLRTDSVRSAPPEVPGRRRAGGLNARDRQQIQRLLGMAQAVRSFRIDQTDSTFTVTNDDGFAYTVHLDGRKTILPLDDSVSVETRAKWDDGALVIEYKPTGGGQLTETYHLADSRRYLRLEVAVEHKAMFRRRWEARMYRRVEAGT
jgi:hypothetical protein